MADSRKLTTDEVNALMEGLSTGEVSGETGVGKTHYFNHKILKNLDEEYYPWCLKEDFQCNYKHQRCVLLDDFRGELTICQLCRMVDKWNTCKVKRKCKRAINFTSEVVCITCPMHPDDLYMPELPCCRSPPVVLGCESARGRP